MNFSGKSDGNGSSFHNRLMNVDRRIIFIVIALSVALPILFPLNLPISGSPQSQAYFDEMEKLKPGDEIIFSFDYEPDTMAELDPMSIATLRHAFGKNLKVLAQTTYAGGVGVAERVLAQTAEEYGKEYGIDYVFLGYLPDYSATMLSLGESIKSTYSIDHYHTDTREIPILRNIDSYDDIELLVTVTASALAEYWIIWAGGRYGQRIIAGNTAIQAILVYPFFQTGQLSGFLGGLKGAAEYEILIDKQDAAVRGMDAQSMAHLLIVVFIVIGNIGFFIQKRKQSQLANGTDGKGVN